MFLARATLLKHFSRTIAEWTGSAVVENTGQQFWSCLHFETVPGHVFDGWFAWPLGHWDLLRAQYETAWAIEVVFSDAGAYLSLSFE